MSNFPSWPGASHCYSRAYRLLDRWAADGGVSMGYNYRRGGKFCAPSQKMVDLIDALNRGDEEYIKGTLLENLCELS